MKEKDLDKCLDNLIIKGLIREAEQDNADFEVAMLNMSDDDFLTLIMPGKTRPQQMGWKIWTAAIASAAAILLLVLVPAHMDMDSRICGSALLASEASMPHSRGMDISSMNDKEIRASLPELERQYQASKRSNDGILYQQAPGKDNPDYYLGQMTPSEAGMDLVQAYLRLGMRDKAVETLRELADNESDPQFGNYCRKMLEILE